MPVNNNSKSRAHPMLIIASTAVAVVCLTGTAALMGWIPSSAAKVTDDTVQVQPQAQQIMAAPQVVAKAPVQRAAPAPVAHRRSSFEPRQHIAQVCQNCGVVESVREINTRGDGSGLGAAGGAVVGGLLGNQVGGGHGKEAMTVVGAIGGAFAGNQIEKQARSVRSYEITVHMNNGSNRTIAQATKPEWRDGDRVKIVDGIVRTNA